MTITEMPRALALVGMPGAGKTLCARHLEMRGFFQFRFGGIVVDEVVRRGLVINPENERIVREEFRNNEGMAAIALRALPHLKAALASYNSIIIDGLYSFSENFGGSTGHRVRKAQYGNQWILTDGGTWMELTAATFSHDLTGKADRLDRYMGVEGGEFFLSHGGFLPGFSRYGERFERPPTSQPPIDFKLLETR